MGMKRIERHRIALEFACVVLLEKRNQERYAMKRIRNMKTMETFNYDDMLEALEEIHDELEQEA